MIVDLGPIKAQLDVVMFFREFFITEDQKPKIYLTLTVETFEQLCGAE
tara:strand:+ start:1056 stop:1199 length:144 start_codon:yes stop_codon:yes gene_type:complete